MKILKSYTLSPVLLLIITVRLHAQSSYTADAAPDNKYRYDHSSIFPQPASDLNWFSRSIEQSPEKEIASCGHTSINPMMIDRAIAAARIHSSLDQHYCFFQTRSQTPGSFFIEQGSHEKKELTRDLVLFQEYLTAKKPGIRTYVPVMRAPEAPSHVSIVSIKAILKKAAVQLSWEAREELNLNVYEVERSTDGSSFQTIGLVFPWDNQEISNSYRFTDERPLSGINYYRLRGVNKNGGIQYSEIVTAGDAPLPVKYFSISPNPAKGNIRAVFSGLEKAVYIVELRNVSGQLQLKKTINIQQPGQVEMLEPGHVPAGIYWLTILDQQQHKLGTSRVVIQ